MTNHVDPDELPVARVYAEALWKIAERDGNTGDVVAEYDAFVSDILDADPNAERLFRTLSLSREQRHGFLSRMFEGRTSDLFFNFLLTLNRHDRLGLVRAVGAALHELQDEAAGVVAVEVRSAVELSQEQQDQVRSLVRDRFNVEPRLQATIDQSLLGGLWIRVGDVVLDRSVKWNLRKLRDAIRTRCTYEIQSGRDFFDSAAGN